MYFNLDLLNQKTLEVLWHSFYSYSDLPYDRNLNILRINSKNELFMFKSHVRQNEMSVQIVWNNTFKSIRFEFKPSKRIKTNGYSGRFLEIFFPVKNRDIKFFECVIGFPVNEKVYRHKFFKDFVFSERDIKSTI